MGTFCGSRGPALYFDAVGEDRFAVTRSMQLTTRDVVQFKVNANYFHEFYFLLSLLDCVALRSVGNILALFHNKMLSITRYNNCSKLRNPYT